MRKSMTFGVSVAPSRSSARFLPSLSLAGLLAFGLGCSSMHGKYADCDGAMTVEFKGSKALVTTMAGTTTEVNYKVDGDNVVLEGPMGKMVLTREKDGSLGGGILGERLIKQPD